MSAASTFRWFLLAFIVGVGSTSFFGQLAPVIFFVALALGGAFLFSAIFGYSRAQNFLLAGILFTFAFGAFRTVAFDEAIALSPPSLLSSSLTHLKESFRQNLLEILPEPHASFAASLLLGARENPSRELREAFRRSGTSHIVAISGWNITIISQFLFGFLLALTLWRRAAFWLTIVGVALFALMVGGQSSVVRAAIMGSLLLFAKRSGRLSSARNALLFAATLMLLMDPQLLRFDIGFQLSFLATLGMIYLLPFFEEKLFSRFPSALGFREALSATLAAQVFVLPVIMAHFETLSLASFPANLAVVPLVPATMLFAFLTGLFGFVSGLVASLVGTISWLFLSYELAIIRFFASLPWASITLPIPFTVLVLYYLVLALWIRRIRPVSLQP